MHSVHVDTRNVVLGALVALVVLVGALLVLAPTASANKEDCPAGKICFWSGPTFGEAAAFFNGSETGCHSLAAINPRSGWNHSGNHTAEFPLTRVIPPGGEFANAFPWGGNVCIS